MAGTGVFATKEELREISEAAKVANNTPCIALSVAHGIEKGGFSGEAHLSAKELCHKLALAHGLPETTGFYGIKNDGEFVRF